jgi:hypothetical protein
MDISLIASSVRPHLWQAFFDSLQSNKCKWEAVFAGDLNDYPQMPNMRYIETGFIKPAQCYEVARRYAIGKLIMWVADDCEFSPELLDNVCRVYRLFNGGNLTDEKMLLSVKTIEDGVDFNLNNHRFFDRNVNTPLMAPLGVISREYLARLGGFDRRFVCGQYENDVAMRVYADGGTVVKHESDVVYIEHLKKHGRSTKFWTAYDKDREVLEDTWVIEGFKPLEPNKTIFDQKKNPPFQTYCPIINREVSRTPFLPFEPYDNANILNVSQSNKGQWI